MNKTLTNSEAVRDTVREGYAMIAQATDAGCCGCPRPESEKLAKELGYAVDELKSLPEGANMGLSCGNPAALAALKPGEVVLDLGSGGGFDVFIAGRKVGDAGQAIGVDMTSEMLARARRNVAGYRQQTGLDNVEFRLGEIENLPVADNSVDVVISNCVINLSPNKPQVWREIARVLKPGGRVAVSDIALLKPLPAEILKLVETQVGCIAGAVLATETEQMVHDAGLTDIHLQSKPGYIEYLTGGDDPLYRQIVEHLPAGIQPADYVTSLEVQARKPDADCCGTICCATSGDAAAEQKGTP